MPSNDCYLLEIICLFVSFLNVDALQNFTGGNLLVVGENATASIWATYPTEGISNGIGFVDQVCFNLTKLKLFFGISKLFSITNALLTKT
jgi:hypothetical protein